MFINFNKIYNVTNNTWDIKPTIPAFINYTHVTYQHTDCTGNEFDSTNYEILSNYSLDTTNKYGYSIIDNKNVVDISNFFNFTNIEYNIAKVTNSIDYISVKIGKLSISNLLNIQPDIKLVDGLSLYNKTIDSTSDVYDINLYNESNKFKININEECYSSGYITVILDIKNIPSTDDHWYMYINVPQNISLLTQNTQEFKLYKNNVIVLTSYLLANANRTFYISYTVPSGSTIRLQVRLQCQNMPTDGDYILFILNSYSNESVVKYILTDISVVFKDDDTILTNAYLKEKIKLSIMNTQRWQISINLLNVSFTNDELKYINKYCYIYFTAENINYSEDVIHFNKKLWLSL